MITDDHINKQIIDSGTKQAITSSLRERSENTSTTVCEWIIVGVISPYQNWSII